MAELFNENTFLFLKQLKRNNKREWFLRNKPRYEKAVKEPFLQFIETVKPPLLKISQGLRIDPRPTKGSMMRIYNDARFSEEPYKTNGAAYFPFVRLASGVETPAFYFHLEPGESFAGGGIWHPDSRTLSRIRNAIVDNPAQWKAVKAKGITLKGDSLKRPPRGYDPEHPFIEDLKKTDFVTSVPFTDKQIQRTDFPTRYIRACNQIAPLIEFLVEALGGKWK